MSPHTSQITSFERVSRKKYSKALYCLREEQPEDWFLRILNENIIPCLSEIGFDNQFTKMLFHLALPAWQKMGPGVIKCLWIHPSLTKDLKVIRKEFIRLAQKKREAHTSLKSMSAHDLHTLAQKNMEPRNLGSLLEEITLSWIILPRAYALLQENDGCCLISYLKYFSREKNADFKILIARIITEFVANFSLKHASTKQPHQSAIEVIFYGYSAMFWKNIDNPQDAELSLHDNFLSWAKAFQHRGDAITNDMSETIKEMAAMKKAVFPSDQPRVFQ